MKPSFTLLLFLSLSFSALAQETPATADRTQRLFDQIDANKDGRLSKDELKRGGPGRTQPQN